MIIKSKGTYDLYGDESRKVLYLSMLFQNLMENFNYEFIRTPIFESSDLFHRGVGETTDIVTKETYDFKDRGDRSLTLRPEGTAGAVRSFIENKMYASSLPKKFWYYGPMFRYERPQSGRYREHYQFGCEVFGSSDPIVDAEIISIPWTLFVFLGLKGVKVNINSLGDEESRESYKKALMTYLEPHIDELCDDCKERFKKNPLRILDCKVDKDNEILKNVPTTIEYLNEASKAHFDAVLKYLEALEINYEVNPKVVRGLDYYTHTVFEITADIKEFGAQNVLCGGGRYDNLINNLEGPKTPAVGFGLGSERLINALDKENINICPPNMLDCYIVPMSNNEKDFALALCNSLRIMGLKCDIDNMNRNIKSNFKQAENLNSIFTLIIGEDELNNNYITVKNMIDKEAPQEKIANKDIIEYIFNELESFSHHDCDCHDHDECCCEEHCECEEECSCDDENNCGCHDHDECNCDDENNCGCHNHDEKCCCKED